MASAEGDVGAGIFAGLAGATVVVVGASSGMGLATRRPLPRRAPTS